MGEKEALDDLLNITGRNGVLCDRTDERLKMSLAMLVDEIGQRWSGFGLRISLCLLQLQEVEVKQDNGKPFRGSFVALQAEVTEAQEGFQVQVVDFYRPPLLVKTQSRLCRQRKIGTSQELWVFVTLVPSGDDHAHRTPDLLKIAV